MKCANQRDRGKSLRSNRALLVIGLIWVVLVAGGFSTLFKEQFTPVASSTPPAVFPATTRIPLATNQLTLIVFAHPHCPCTEATFRQLDQLLATAPGKLSLVVVFAFPPHVQPGWEQGDLLTKAKSLSGCHIVLDKDNREARQFNVVGSGHVLVYSPGGALLFSGGITASRGHDGDNLGRSAIASLALTGQSSLQRTPVFGCSLN